MTECKSCPALDHGVKGIDWKQDSMNLNGTSLYIALHNHLPIILI